MIAIKRALISVYDKAGLQPLLQSLHSYGCQFVSTSGTSKAIRELGFKCEEISDLTGYPHLLEGRVKTLHPAVFAGILQRGTSQDLEELKQHSIQPLTLVVANLYPFAQELAKGKNSFAEQLEFIDIGGIALIRAAAKNPEQCVVLTNPTQYDDFCNQLSTNRGAIDLAHSRSWAAAAYLLSSGYDRAIADFMSAAGSSEIAPSPPMITLSLSKIEELVYGENPQQKAALYSDGNLKPPQQLQGKPLSYNNLLDLEAACAILSDFNDKACCVIIKHTNPCGLGVGSGSKNTGAALTAFEYALAGDPKSAFGGIVGFNQAVDEKLASALSRHFFEMIVAPEYTSAALTELKKKQKLRLIQAAATPMHTSEIRQTRFGYLRQTADVLPLSVCDAKVVSRRQPQEDELAAADLAWRACKWVKSNAIVIANSQQVIGVGAGQMSRVDAVELAIKKAHLPLSKAALASDAFFPFRDSIDIAKRAGIGIIVQPGGSIRDAEVIQAADEHGLCMLLTHERHFRH